MHTWATPVRAASLLVAGGLAIMAMSGGAWAAQQGGDPSTTDTSAAPDLITGTDVQAIADELFYYDAEPEITKDDGGYPQINVDDSETPFQVFFHECNADTKNCGSIEFVAWWDLKSGVPAATIDKWNQTKLWGVAYRDKQNDPHLSMTVELADGVTVDNFDDIVDDWDDAMNDFSTTIGWKKK